jgi:glycosyltransferase involved in cell wall biosynthesis
MGGRSSVDKAFNPHPTYDKARRSAMNPTLFCAFGAAYSPGLVPPGEHRSRAFLWSFASQTRENPGQTVKTRRRRNDRPSLPRVLYMVHALPPEEFSGTPLVVQGYARRLAQRGAACAVVYASLGEQGWDTGAVPDGEGFLRYPVPLTPYRAYHWCVEAASDTAPDATSSAAFDRILDDFAPDVVHVVDNVHLPLAWPEHAVSRGYRVVRTVSCTEDLCGMIAPVSPRSGARGFCAAPLTPSQCADCLLSAGVYPSDEQGATRRWLVEALERKRQRAGHQYGETFERLIFSSDDFRRYFEDSMALRADRVQVVPMGLDPLPGQQRRSSATAGPLVFLLAGMLDRAKGFSSVVEAFSSPALTSRHDYRLEIRGGGEVAHLASLCEVNPNVHYGGPYTPEDLVDLLSRVDVGISASYFETFHRVTREYFHSGVPVIGSRTFGIPDIVRDGLNGLLFDGAEPSTLVRAVLRCLDEPDLVPRLRGGACDTVVRSVDNELDDLVALYRATIR